MFPVWIRKVQKRRFSWFPDWVPKVQKCAGGALKGRFSAFPDGIPKLQRCVDLVDLTYCRIHLVAKSGVDTAETGPQFCELPRNAIDKLTVKIG